MRVGGLIIWSHTSQRFLFFEVKVVKVDSVLWINEWMHGALHEWAYIWKWDGLGYTLGNMF